MWALCLEMLHLAQFSDVQMIKDHWDMCLYTMKDVPADEVLESLFKRQLKTSTGFRSTYDERAAERRKLGARREEERLVTEVLQAQRSAEHQAARAALRARSFSGPALTELLAFTLSFAIVFPRVYSL